MVNVVFFDSASVWSSVFSRQISVRVSVPIETVRENLVAQLSDYVVIPAAAYRFERRYWGELNGDNVTLHGPKTYRQMQFLTVGTLKQSSDETVLTATIQVAKKELISLLLLLTVMTGWITFIHWPLLLTALPFYAAVFFGVIAFNFSKHTPEIMNLFEQLMLGESPYRVELLL